MSLKLYYHPLASFCWKALIALHEIGALFAPHTVDLGNHLGRLMERPSFARVLVEAQPYFKFFPEEKAEG